MYNAHDASVAHSKLRVVQRHGLRLSLEELQRLVVKIQRGDAIPLRKISTTRTIFAVTAGRFETMIPVVYSSSRKAIVTVLPESVLERYRDHLAKATGRREGSLYTCDPTTIDREISTHVVQDPQVDRLIVQVQAFGIKALVYAYWKEIAGARVVTYIESRRLCAAGLRNARELLMRQFQARQPKIDLHLRKAHAERFVNEVIACVSNAGLNW